jgi:lactate dehydrogenase-like 2-hydroxyacid dehydrogenase
MREKLAVTLFPASKDLERGLRDRFQVVGLDKLSPGARAAWLTEHGQDVAAVVTNGKTGCPSELIEALASLEIIAIHGVGYDKIDLRLAGSRNVIVCNTPGVLTDDVADLAVGLVIALLRQVPRADSFLREGRWEHGEFPLSTRVSGKRFGIVGLGRIGEAIATRLSSFGPISYTSRGAKEVPWTYVPDLCHMALQSDVLIIACSASRSTERMVNREVLAALGEKGFLVNVARGSIVDEAALSEALESGQLAGAALDVFADEPQPSAGLRLSSRTTLTPHLGSATHESRKAMAEMVLANLDAHFAGAVVPHPLHP